MSAPSFKLSELAEKLGLKLVLNGDAEDIVITGINTLEEAGPTELSFLANPKYVSQLATTKAGAVILREEHESEVTRALVTENPYPMFAQALTLFAKPQGSFKGISHMAFVHPEAELGEDCTVYPFCYIGPRTRLGKGCTVFPAAISERIASWAMAVPCTPAPCSWPVPSLAKPVCFRLAPCSVAKASALPVRAKASVRCPRSVVSRSAIMWR